MKICYRHIIRSVALWLLLGGLANGQEPLQIPEVAPRLENDTLHCRFACPNLFTGNIRQTLLSGLPVLIELGTGLKTENGARLVQRLDKYRLTYDIWEDQFLQESATTMDHFTTLDALSRWWNPRENLPVAPLKALPAGTRLVLTVDLRVILLTRTQGQQLKDWIINTNETEEELPTASRDTGFKLDLMRLFSLLFSRSDVIEQFEARQSSEKFFLDGGEIRIEH